MSCFIVSPAHLNALVSAAITTSITDGPLQIGDVIVSRENRDLVGQILLETNTRSVNARYGDDEMLAYHYEIPARVFEAVEILKAIDCYEYQSCEAPHWAASPAKSFCDQLRRRYIHLLDGYDDAPWEITRK